MNQRLILVLVIVISAIATIALNNAHATSDKWYDSRDFYKKINKMDMFDKYPYDQAKLIVKITHISNQKVTRDFIVQYGKDTLFVDHKEFKKDNNAKVMFYIDEDEKNKVCMMSYEDNYQKCKKFKSYDDKNTVEFFVN